MTKPFIVANVREIMDLLDRNEISYSRMVEMLNEKAAEFYKQEVAKEREKAKNLIIDAKRVLELYTMSKSGRLDGWPSPTEWELATGNLEQSLNEYEKV